MEANHSRIFAAVGSTLFSTTDFHEITRASFLPELYETNMNLDLREFWISVAR